MSKKEKESETRRKRDQNKANRGGKSSSGQGKKPINVSTHTGGRKSRRKRFIIYTYIKHCYIKIRRMSKKKSIVSVKYSKEILTEEN